MFKSYLKVRDEILTFPMQVMEYYKQTWSVADLRMPWLPASPGQQQW